MKCLDYWNYNRNAAEILAKFKVIETFCYSNNVFLIWQKRSTAAAANRAKLRSNHVGGLKSLVQYLEEAKVMDFV